MSDWRLKVRPMPPETADPNEVFRYAYYLEDNDFNPYGPIMQVSGYTVKLLRDIHRALQSLSDSEYSLVADMLDSEEELYE